MSSVPSARRNAESESRTVAEETSGEVVESGNSSGQVVAHFWSGPLPSPESFNKYPESVQNRIMTMAENESEHRRATETKDADARIAAEQKTLHAEIDHDRRGQTYTFVLVALVVIVSGALVWGGHTWGLSILVVGIVAALNPFIEKLKELFSSGKKESR